MAIASAIGLATLFGAIGAGTQVAGAVMGSRASKNAAKAQEAAADRALELRRNMWDTTQQQFRPYLAAGTAATNQVASLLMPSYNPTAAAVPTSTSGGLGASMLPGLAAAAGGAPGRLLAFPGVQAKVPVRAMAGASAAAGAMVRIRHPRTGEVRVVPAAQVEALKAKGGQVVAA